MAEQKTADKNNTPPCEAVARGAYDAKLKNPSLTEKQLEALVSKMPENKACQDMILGAAAAELKKMPPSQKVGASLDMHRELKEMDPKLAGQIAEALKNLEAGTAHKPGANKKATDSKK